MDQATIKLQQRSCSPQGTAIKPMTISCGTIIAMGLRAVTARLTQKSTTTWSTTITGADVHMAVSCGELAVAQLSKITSCTTTALPTLPIPTVVQTPTFANNHCTNTGTGCAQSGDPLFADQANRDLVLSVGSPDRGAGTPYIAVNISWPFVPDIGAMLDDQP